MSVRRAIVEVDVSTLNVSEFCRLHGISTWSFYAVRRRYAAEGVAALEPRSRAPKRVANKTEDVLRDRIVLLRKELADDGLDNGPATIRVHLERADGWAPSESTIWRVLRERGFITPEPRKRPKHAHHRFSADRANECWQIDATKWWLADGTMIEIINVIDDCTRVLIASIAVATCTTANAWDTICHGANTWGWPERVLSDNGTPFRGKNGKGGMLPALTALGIKDSHSRPYHPQTCGKVERFHQTLKRHLDTRSRPDTLADLQAQLDHFSHVYNHVRPHRSISRRVPAEVWNATPRSAPAGHPIGTPTVAHTRVVEGGRISIGNHLRIGLGAPYNGQTAIAVITGNGAHVFIEGRVVRQLTINPDRRDQPRLDNPAHQRKGV
jgi:transposase InsO family protein